MKAIVGSSDLWPIPSLASMLLTLMVSTNEHFAVRLPHPDSDSASSMTEDLVLRIGNRIDRRVFVFPCNRSYGSSAAWKRDVELVKSVTEVYAFFGAGGINERGTGHVLSLAMNHNKSVTAFCLNGQGEFDEVGSIQLPPTEDIDWLQP